MFACKPTNAASGVGRAGGDGLIQFVSQGSGQLSHGGYPIHSRELCVRLTQSFAFFLRPLALGDVDSGAHQFDELAGRTENRMPYDVDVSDLAGRSSG